ncbi:MAG: O-antigen ligase family protein [Elusimicrobiota bacterium]
MTDKSALLFGSILALLLPVSFLPFTSDNFLIKLLILSVFFTVFAVLLTQNKFKIAKVSIWIIIFTGYLGISILWSPNKSVAINTFWRRMVIILSGYFIGINIPSKRLNILFKAIIAGAVISAVYGIIQYAGLDPVSWKIGFSGRISSFLGNPNFFSGYLVAVFPLSLYFADKAKKQKKVFWFLMSAVLVFCVVMTGTRSSLIALAAELIILYFGFKNKTVRTAVGAFVILMIILVIASPSKTKRLIKGFSFNSSSVSQRVFKWNTALSMVKDSPLIGQGIGGVKTNYALFQSKTRKKMQTNIKGTSESQIHSEYLQVFAQAGIIGFILFMIILIYGIKNFLHSKEKEKLILFPAYAGILIDSLASFPLFIVPTGFIFYLYLGISENNRTQIKIPGYLGAVISLLIVIGCIKFGIISFYADCLRRKADSIRKIRPLTAHKLYNKAHKLSPVDGQAEYRHGQLLFEMGKYSQSEQALKNSIYIRNYGEVYNDLGIVYYKQKKFKKALNAWEKAYKIGLPDNEDMQSLRKNILILSNKLETKNPINYNHIRKNR